MHFVSTPCYVESQLERSPRFYVRWLKMWDDDHCRGSHCEGLFKFFVFLESTSGSVLINAHHVFFWTFALSSTLFCFSLWFFVSIFDICPWVAACDAISLCLLLFSIWYIYAMPSRECLLICFYAAVTWWRVIDDHRFENADCWRYLCVGTTKCLVSWY